MSDGDDASGVRDQRLLPSSSPPVLSSHWIPDQPSSGINDSSPLVLGSCASRLRRRRDGDGRVDGGQRAMVVGFGSPATPVRMEVDGVVRVCVGDRLLQSGEKGERMECRDVFV